MKRGFLLVFAALAVSGCDRFKRIGDDGNAVPTPTVMVDSTRTDGPPITFDELSRGLAGRWYLKPGVGDPRMPDEWNFSADGTWRTPSFSGYEGRYEFLDTRTLQMIHNQQRAQFGFTLVGDEFTVYFENLKFPYLRVPTPAAKPNTGTPPAGATATPATGTPPAGAGGSPATATTRPGASATPGQ